MFLMHNEAKQTQTLEFGAEKVHCRAWKETGSLCSENPELLKGFQQSTFKGRLREGRG